MTATIFEYEALDVRVLEDCRMVMQAEQSAAAAATARRDAEARRAS